MSNVKITQREQSLSWNQTTPRIRVTGWIPRCEPCSGFCVENYGHPLNHVGHHPHVCLVTPMPAGGGDTNTIVHPLILDTTEIPQTCMCFTKYRGESLNL